METKSPHFWWIISIMAITIIALLSFILAEKICNANKIMEFMQSPTANAKLLKEIEEPAFWCVEV